jgi:hypothetical protein
MALGFNIKMKFAKDKAEFFELCAVENLLAFALS